MTASVLELTPDMLHPMELINRFNVVGGQFQLGTPGTDGTKVQEMAIYESINGVNFYKTSDQTASGFLSAADLPSDVRYVYVTEKDAKKYDGGTVIGTGANITIEGTAGRIKGFADSSAIGAQDRIQVTGTLTGGIATLDASGIEADSLRVASTYSNVAATGALSGATGTVTVVVANGGGITSIVVGNAAGAGYVPGESITIADSLLGDGGAADITFTVATTNAGVGIVSGTTYEVKLVDDSNGQNASAQVELIELNGDPVVTSGSALKGLTFTLLNESALGSPVTLTQLQASSKYLGTSTLHLYVDR